MALRVAFILALCLVACECHYFPTLHPDSYWHLWQRYFDGDHPEKSLGSCSKSSTCGEGKICCLNNHQGHCFNNHLTISNSDICLTDTDLAGNGLNSRCQEDSDCTDAGTWCEYNRSNKWGTCVYDLCSGINTGRCNDGTCAVSGTSSRDHSFKCTCDANHYGADCSIDHPCQLTGFDAVCGSNGECNEVTSFNNVYPEDVEEEDVFTCTCEDGWLGTRCNKEHPCYKAVNPCGDTGGFCAADGDSFVCWCPLNTWGVDCAETCGNAALEITADDAAGAVEIKSPNFDTGAFPTDIRCEWIITSDDSAKKVKIEFETFELELNPICHWDFLKAWETVETKETPVGPGTGEVGTAVAGRYCGSELPDPLLSTTNSMTILFNSDRKNNLKGFKAIATRVAGGG